MFDWDKDQESLVAISDKPSTADDRAGQPGLRGKLGMGLLSLLIAAGFAYEKDALSRIRGGASVGTMLFDPSATASTRDSLPEGLLAYDDAQARQYLRGLRLADTAILHAYASRLRSDLAYADPLLVPFFRDAETLVLTEMARRDG